MDDRGYADMWAAQSSCAGAGTGQADGDKAAMLEAIRKDAALARSTEKSFVRAEKRKQERLRRSSRRRPRQAQASTSASTGTAGAYEHGA